MSRAVLSFHPRGELISARLAKIGMSVSAFARALGVRPSFVHAVKKGKRRLTKPETVERAAHILGLPADALFVAGGHLPPDAWALIQRRPQLVQGVRILSARIDARHDREAEQARR